MSWSPLERKIFMEIMGRIAIKVSAIACAWMGFGPTSWLSEYVLGVQVVEPGCRTVRIIPHLGDLEWVEGTFPTPYGVIEIRHEKGADGKVISHINAPEEIRVTP